MSKFIDMTGWIMKEHGVPQSRWTVINRADDYSSLKKKKCVKWNCQCECGRIKAVDAQMLRNGGSLSCGCLHNEQFANITSKSNKYNLSGEYGIGYTEKGEEFWFDLEDYNKISKYCWHYDKHGDLVCRDKTNNNYYKFQRFVMNAPDGITVDHIRHDKRPLLQYDNRKSNLRLATTSQQMMNTSLRKNNSSGHTGVYNRNGKWNALLTEHHITHNLGTYKTFEEAVKAREKAEVEYFREYRYNANN